MDWRIDVRRRDGQLVVTPWGELDMATVPSLTAALRDEGADGDAFVVVLDLSELEFVDTSGLRLVLEEQRRAEEEGHELRLVRGRPPVQRVFELAGVTERLPFVDAPG